MNRTSKLLSSAALSATLAACTLGPDFSRPAAPASGGYAVHAAPPAGSAQGVIYGGEVADGWYQLFHSEALNGLVRDALANNPDLEAARHGLLAAQDELRAVSGSALPQIDAKGGINRTHINGSFLYAPVNTLTTTANQYSIGPTLAYNLDIFGGVRRSIEAQGAATANARDQALNTYVTLVDQVVISAFDYAASEAQIEVTQSLLNEFQAQFDLTQKLEAAGKITRSDTLQALQHDADSYTAHTRALDAAAASRDLALAQYRAGKFNELQVLTVEQQYQNAALTQVQADAQRFTDTAALFRALGGGWWNAAQDPSSLPLAANDAKTTNAAPAKRAANAP